MKSILQTNTETHNFATPVRLLVATDLSDGKYLIPHIVAQAKASNALVTLVHAILPTESMPIDAGFSIYVDVAKIEQGLRGMLLGMAEQIRGYGVLCETVLKHGMAAEVILEQIRITGAERLLMASHGRGKLGQFLMGSVANQILGSVDIPVFVVGHQSTGLTRPRRILHPVSLVGDYRKSLDFAVELARANHAELTLLHIADSEAEKFIQPGCTLNEIDCLSQKIFPEAASLVPPVEVRIAFGNVVEAIQNLAAEKAVDWIVLGVGDKHGVWPFTESVAYKVMAGVECPVMTLRHEVASAVLVKVPEDHALAMIG